MFKFKTYYKIIVSLFAFVALAPSTFAATYSFKDAPVFVRGCSATIEVMLDTEGSSILAGDSTILFDGSEIEINQITAGTALPMMAYSSIDANTAQISLARFPKTGSFNGVDVFAYLNITPIAEDFTLSFSPDLINDNNLVDDTINNVLSNAISKKFIVSDRFDTKPDGSGGFCEPDDEAPIVDFVYPKDESGEVEPNADIILIIQDNRSLVDLDQFEAIVDGVGYARYSNEVTINEQGGIYRIKINPKKAFDAGKKIDMEVAICDKNSTNRNCSSYTSSFNVALPGSRKAICGDGILNVNEQCDDGNNKSGDGCNVFCAIEKKLIKTKKLAPLTSNNAQNNSEKSVICPNPTSSYTKPDSSELVMICHSAKVDNKTKKFSLLIPKNQLSAHKLKGDTLGACPVFDLCPQSLLLAEPKREEEAINNTKEVVKNEGVINESKAKVSLPTAIAENPLDAPTSSGIADDSTDRSSSSIELVRDQIDLCKTNVDFSEANLDVLSSDIDGDGLSDRFECFANTHPLKPDSDGDGCTDYDELNLNYTDPNDGSDCEVKLDLDRFSEILITDPKPGWVLSTTQPTIGGKIPLNAQFVIAVANGAEQNYIDQINESMQALLKLEKDSAPTRITSSLQAYNDSLEDIKNFFKENEDSFTNQQLIDFIDTLPDELSVQKVFDESFKDELESFRFELLKYKTEPITAIASTEFDPTLVGELEANIFEGRSAELNDKTLYDLVVTTYLNDGNRLNSKAIRFSIDTATKVNKPRPRTIGNKSIDEKKLSQIIIGDRAYAQSEGENFEIEIRDERPTITGEAEFGTNVYAIWRSVVLASSVISDSEEGAFEIQAPRALEVNTPHRVSLYAVKDNNGNKIRSESVDVYFRVKTRGLGAVGWVAIVVILAIALSAGGYFYIAHRRKNNSLINS